MARTGPRSARNARELAARVRPRPAGLAMASFFARRPNDDARDIEWRSGWVAGARAILRARLPGAKPLMVPPGVLPRMLDVRSDQELRG